MQLPVQLSVIHSNKHPAFGGVGVGVGDGVGVGEGVRDGAGAGNGELLGTGTGTGLGRGEGNGIGLGIGAGNGAGAGGTIPPHSVVQVSNHVETFTCKLLGNRLKHSVEEVITGT